MAKPLCPRCEAGTAGLEKRAALAAAAAAVSQLPIAPPLRADETVYAARLTRCGECSALREGLFCAYCGCFVQFRARIAKSHCPNPAGDSWQDIPQRI